MTTSFIKSNWLLVLLVLGILVMLVFFSLALISIGGGCNVMPIDNGGSDTAQEQGNYLFSQNAITSNQDINSSPYIYKGDYKDISFIHFYGDVDKEKIMNIVYLINPKYFVGVDSLDVVHTKFDILRNAGVYTENAMYVLTAQGHGQIRWYVDNEDSRIAKHDILHELKHHYCWVNGNRWNNNAEAHQGCFLNTPIDREYNSNKEFGYNYIK